jgi:hypothetical protein
MKPCFHIVNFLACKFLGIVESQIEKERKLSLGDVFCNGTIFKS